MRSIYFVLGILIVGTVAMAYLYFSNLKNDNNANELSLNAVTAQSGIVFTYNSDNSFYEILAGQELFKDILGTAKWKILQSLQQSVNGSRGLKKVLTGQKVYIGIVPGEKNEVNFLISTQLKEKFDLLRNLDWQLDKPVVKKIGEDYQINFGDSASCFVRYTDNLVLLSNNQKTLQKNAGKENITNEFGEYLKSNNRFNKNTLANLYIDFNKVPTLLKKTISTNLDGALSVLEKLDGYAALNYNFSRDKLLFNGYTVLNGDVNYQKLFIDEKERKMSIDQILPAETSNYALYTVDNYEVWKQKLAKYFRSTQELEKINKNIKSINEKYRLDINNIFPKHFKNQLITFQLNSGEKFGALALDNGDKVAQLLIDLSADYAPEIKIFKEANILYNYFGEPFKKFERPFFTIIDNYLVVSNHASSIQAFLNSYQNDRLLIKTEKYAKFTDQLSSSATICYYVDNKNSNDIFGKNLASPYLKQYQSSIGFKNYIAFCYQLSADNGKFLTNLLLLKNNNTAGNTSTAINIKTLN